MKIIRILTDSACKIWLWLLLLASSMSHAVTYFEQCDSALKKPSFHLLTHYLDTNNQLLDSEDEYSKPDKCFQLNSHQFLVTAGDEVDAIPVVAGATYWCDFAKPLHRDQQCLVEKNNQILMQSEVKEEFDDVKGKHFVLFERDDASMGQAFSSYGVVYLVKPSNASYGLPFTMQDLLKVSYYYGVQDQDISSEDSEFVCPVKDDGVQNNVEKYTVGQDSEGHADLKFNISQEDCHTHKIKHYTREFVFNSGRFQEVKAGSVKIEKQVIAPAASKVQ